MPKSLTVDTHYLPEVTVSVLEDWKEITVEIPEYMVMGNSVECQTGDSDSECFEGVKGKEMVVLCGLERPQNLW